MLGDTHLHYETNSWSYKLKVVPSATWWGLTRAFRLYWTRVYRTCNVREVIKVIFSLLSIFLFILQHWRNCLVISKWIFLHKVNFMHNMKLKGTLLIFLMSSKMFTVDNTVKLSRIWKMKYIYFRKLNWHVLKENF